MKESTHKSRVLGRQFGGGRPTREDYERHRPTRHEGARREEVSAPSPTPVSEEVANAGAHEGPAAIPSQWMRYIRHREIDHLLAALRLRFYRATDGDKDALCDMLARILPRVLDTGHHEYRALRALAMERASESSVVRDAVTRCDERDRERWQHEQELEQRMAHDRRQFAHHTHHGKSRPHAHAKRHLTEDERRVRNERQRAAKQARHGPDGHIRDDG